MCRQTQIGLYVVEPAGKNGPDRIFLPVGTAGAYRYKLSPHASDAQEAKAAVYGYLLATVSADGKIDFSFKQLEESDVPKSISSRYTPKFVHWCFAANHE